MIQGKNLKNTWDIYNYEVKENIYEGIKDVFKKYGYRQISTSIMEQYKLFLNNKGTFGNHELYKFIDSRGEVLVLRPDMTIPITNIVANKNQDIDEMKLFYISKIFRMGGKVNKTQKEFLQGGIEYFGNNTTLADAEVISIAIKTLKRFCDNFTIDIGHTEFYRGVFENIKINTEAKNKLRRLIQDKNQDEIQILLQKIDILDNHKEIISKLPKLYGNFGGLINEIRTIPLNSRMEKALKELEEINDIITELGYEDYISFDLGLINDLHYYTGTIFNGYMDNYGSIILNGGRYDKLAENYGKDIPATGFGVNIDKLINGLGGEDMLRANGSNIDYEVIYPKNNRKRALLLAEKLRDVGYITVVKDKDNSLKNYIEIAERERKSNLILLDNERLKIIDVVKNTSNNIKYDDFIKKINLGFKNLSIH
ncbi:ATP phosphoribosyltransferase regulatory subunit [Dethiothermospora halolimnae]|uniref:ATP phosphoribosyltransferase regulatory subunit n=1 Tax=Dethiothermospora halolimnae TaxID=3114390 RepID=UPI003CCC128D